MKIFTQCKKTALLLATTVMALTLIPFEGVEAASCLSKCSGPQSHFGKRRLSNKPLPNQFNIVVWNVSRGGGPLGRQTKELKQLTKNADIVLLQDATTKSDFTSSIKAARPDFHWSLARGLEMRTGHASGVVTGSKYKPVRSTARRSTVREPITNTPRSMLLTTYKLAKRSERLLLVNIHAVGFGSDKTFRRHIQQMIGEVKKHKGPLVIGGDFNSWQDSRLKYLLKETKKLGLAKVEMSRGPLHAIDQVFVRGLKVVSAEEMSDYESSDQKPVRVGFELEDSLRLAHR